MAYADMREFTSVLEEAGELRRVPDEVDWRYEVGGWLRHCYDARPFGPALLFEKIKDYSSEYRIVGNLLGSYQRIARAIGLPPDTPSSETIAAFEQRLKSPVAPKIVSSGPVKENVHVGDKVDLLEFPVPWWTPMDGGRYIGTWHINVSKDAETGLQNVGTYRVMVRDRNTASVAFLPYTHMSRHYAQRKARGEPLETAMVIGADETVSIVGGVGFPLSVDEITVAGALRGAPIELVKCETVDLFVPANAEIVVEGLVLPSEMRPEGPLGEHTGYHGGGVRMRPVFQVTAITHRDRPILRGSLLGRPVLEHNLVRDVIASAAAMELFESFGPDGVLAVRCPPEGAATLSAIVQMRPRYVGHAFTVGQTLLSSHLGKSLKYIVLVDDDIDPSDLGQVWWAVLTRTQASRDFEVLRYRPATRSDPSIPRAQGEYGDKLIIDATKKLDYPYNAAWGGHWAPTATPPPEVMELVRRRWKQVFDGDSSCQGDIARLTQRLENEFHPKWEKWREESYKVSEEDQKRELGRSYPGLLG